jgi:P-type Cu2+ transporter
MVPGMRRAHCHAAAQRADEAHGHGHGGHAGMSLDAIARDMRNRFVVALAFTIPVVLWSNVGKNLLGSELAPRSGSTSTSGSRC